MNRTFTRFQTTTLPYRGNQPMYRLVLTACLIAFSLVKGVLNADDWPQWLGPNRDSIWRETGIVESIPDSGLPVKWRAPVSLGYSGPAVADGKVFITDYQRKSGDVSNNPGGRAQLEGDERVFCLSASTGKRLWTHSYPCAYNVSYPGGPRCTPTVDGDRVYTLGTEGNLLCLTADEGRIVWQIDLRKAYDVESPLWGFSAHPLVDGDLLYCMVGGKGSVIVAFNKQTGEEVWSELTSSGAGYCPPTMIRHGGVKQLLVWDPEHLSSLNPENGEVYWSLPLKPNYGMSITAPRKLDSSLYVSGIGDVGVLLELADKSPEAKARWYGTAKSAVYCGNSTPFLQDGTIYGADCQLGALIAARMTDGERLWETFEATTGGTRRASHGTAFLVKHQDRFFLATETGDLVLARLSPEKYEELGRFHMLEPTNECFGRPVVWSHPAFARQCVFARNDKEIVCVDLSAP